MCTSTSAARRAARRCDGAAFAQLSLRHARHALTCVIRLLVVVDRENEQEDSRQLLRALHTRAPGVSTVAIGTALQLAAQAQEADGWLEVSEPAARLPEVANSLARARHAAPERQASPAAQGWARTWRSLSSRQRQVLALLGCGLDNHKLADALGVSERAVTAHVSALLSRFKAGSRD